MNGMRVALRGRMLVDKSISRCIAWLLRVVCTIPLASQLASAEVLAVPDRAIVLAEARISYGLALGGGSGGATRKATPVGLEILAESAITEQPWTSLYGGVLFESFGRQSVGAVLGARIRPDGTPLRFSAGLIGIAVPTTLGGATMMLGACQSLGGTSICCDLEAVAFVVGKDLPDGRVATQLKVGVALAFDLL